MTPRKTYDYCSKLLDQERLVRMSQIRWRQATEAPYLRARNTTQLNPFFESDLNCLTGIDRLQALLSPTSLASYTTEKENFHETQWGNEFLTAFTRFDYDVYWEIYQYWYFIQIRLFCFVQTTYPVINASVVELVLPLLFYSHTSYPIASLAEAIKWPKLVEYRLVLSAGVGFWIHIRDVHRQVCTVKSPVLQQTW